MKATVLGAAGGIGQSLSLLLKINCHLISELSLYDVVNSHGVGADLSHISTNTLISSYLPENDGLQKALCGADFVIIPAGIPRKPGMTRDDLFSFNAKIIALLAEGVARYCPGAFVLVISNPVNSTVPVFAETLKKFGVFNARKLFGVTTLDIVRAKTFIADLTNKKPQSFRVPVIGGHSGATIVPLFSVGAPEAYSSLSDETKSALIHRVQYGGDEVVEAKDGKGSATLSMAYAAYALVNQILTAVTSGLDNEVVSYIYLDDSIKGASELKSKINGLDYFAIPVKLGKEGIEIIDSQILDRIDQAEGDMLEEAIEKLQGDISKGVSFIRGQ